MRHFADRLIEQIEKVGNYGCLGIDPRRDWNPNEHIRLSTFLTEVTAGKLPAIKPQAAFLGDDKQEVDAICAYARRLGILSIGDVKRGDIGTTAEAYAEAWFDRSPTMNAIGMQPSGPDAITVNPYLGADSLEPFVKVAAREGRGIFVLVRTSNPGANDIQGLKVQQALDRPYGAPIETVCEHVARMVDKIGRDHVGERGYSLVGAVVGATVDPTLVARLRELMPRAIFLMPGLGAQGGGMDSIRAALDKNGLGVLAPSSRSLNYPWKKKDGSGDAPVDWKGAVEKAIGEFATSLRIVKP